jgi:hypothetical protein
MLRDADYERLDHVRELQKELELRERHEEALSRRVEVWQGDITAMAVDAIGENGLEPKKKYKWDNAVGNFVEVTG